MLGIVNDNLNERKTQEPFWLRWLAGLLIHDEIHVHDPILDASLPIGDLLVFHGEILFVFQ